MPSQVRIWLDTNCIFTHLGLIHLVKYIPYLHIRYATPRQHMYNPAWWNDIGVCQLELNQKTSKIFCYDRLLDAA